MANLAKTLSPHYNIVNLDYFKINGNLYLPSTVVPSISNYLSMEENEKDIDDSIIINKLMEVSNAIGG